MKFITVTFEIYDDELDDDKQSGPEQMLAIPMDQLARARPPLLPSIVSDQASRYWQTLVLMGETE